MTASPGTLVRMGDLRQPVVLATVAGLLLIVVLLGFRVRGAILMGILATTAICALMGLVHYQGIFSMQIHLAPTFWKFDLAGLLRIPPARLGTAIFVLFYLALFDTVGTLVGVGQQAGLVRDGKLPRVERALFADAVGTTVGAALGTSTITCYIESAAGVSDGARTGLASVVTGILLAASLFFSPLAAMIGGGVKVGQSVLYPTLAPALIVVGSMMLQALARTPLGRSHGIPAGLPGAGGNSTYLQHRRRHRLWAYFLLHRQACHGPLARVPSAHLRFRRAVRGAVHDSLGVAIALTGECPYYRGRQRCPAKCPPSELCAGELDFSTRLPGRRYSVCCAFPSKCRGRV